MATTLATVPTNLLKTMAKGFKNNGKQNENRPKGMEGVNLLTNMESGVYLEGAEETIEMYENGKLTQRELYDAIMDLEVVYRSKDEKR